MNAKRFQVLAGRPLGDGVGEIRYGNVRGYIAGEADTLDEAKMFCGSAGDRFGPLRIIDATTYDGKTVKVVYSTTK